MTLLTILPLVLVCAPSGLVRDRAPDADPRDDYDVLCYRLDLRVDPAEERLSGTVAVEVRVVAEHLGALVLDMRDALEPQAVVRPEQPLGPATSLAGERLRFRHDRDLLTCLLPEPLPRGERLTVAVRYSGMPTSVNGFDGFHWSRTPSGAPWISTSCQGLGAHYWWPCKASFYNPEDKQDRLFVNATVPAGLTAVSNGRLTGRETEEDGWETFHWRHDYPCETYSVCLNVAPYEVVADELSLPGIDHPVPFAYWVLPEHLERARVQFADVPRFLEVMSDAFGPWPFPESKVGLVETSFWGMEHSTAVAYGSSFPAWIAQHGGVDPYAERNRFFDYILIHEMAHEWWGNAVSAADWSDFWLHEGFATYAEGVYVERVQGREQADRFFTRQERFTHPKARLLGAPGSNSKQAYNSAIYSKGACVLNTLRYFVDDDDAWWRALRTFNLQYRYRNASTEDFRAVVEAETGRSWERFFDEWVRGAGQPRLEGWVALADGELQVRVSNPEREGTSFHVPLDLAWKEGEVARRRRVMLEPGDNRLDLPVGPAARELAIEHLDRVLGPHQVAVH